MASSFNDSIVDNNSGGEDETKFDSFVFQEQYRHNETADESANNHRVVTSKRYKQGLQFDPLVIEEEILLEGENQHQKVIPTGFQQVLFFLKLSSFWFANALLLACLVTIVWPSQIAALVGDDKKEAYNGIIPALGAVVSMVVSPIAGILSDYSTHSLGRRNVYIITGSAVCILFLVWGGSLNKGTSIWMLMLCSAGIQFGANWAAGPYAGLMPDLVPQSKIGLASGYLGLSLAVGDLLGIGVSGKLTSKENYWPVYIFIAVAYGVFILPTVIGIKEKPVRHTREQLTASTFIKSFYLNPREYRDFYWVLITRFLEQMGVYSILPYLQYYMQDVVKVDSPEFWGSIMLGVLVISSIPASIIAGKLSDRVGRKPMVYASSGILTLGMVFLSFETLAPSVSVMMAIGVVMGVGYGAYQAVDWALALDVIPPGANIAKDMGIWHVAVVFPQVISPAITGAILTGLKKSSIERAYVVVCIVTAIWFLLATVFVYPVQRARPPAHTITEEDLELPTDDV